MTTFANLMTLNFEYITEDIEIKNDDFLLIESITDDIEIKNDDFSLIEAMAQEVNKPVCIQWFNDETGQEGFWGPKGLRKKPFWYNIPEKPEWKKTVYGGWIANYRSQFITVRPYRRGNGKLCYVPRVNTLSKFSPAKAYLTLKEARKKGIEFADEIANSKENKKKG